MIDYQFQGRLQYIPGGALNVQMSAWPVAGGPTSPGTTNLISWWSLDETGHPRYDSHGSNHPSDNNTVGYATGKVSNAADFVAANTEYLSLANNSTIRITTTDFTIALWFKLDATNAYASGLFGKRDAINRDYFLDVRHSTTDHVRFFFYSDSTTAHSVGGGGELPISLGTWYFVVVRWNNTSKLLEIILDNGTPVTATYAGVTPQGTAALLFMGNLPNLANYQMDGQLDEVCFYKRVLTDGEIEWLYNSGNGRAYSEL